MTANCLEVVSADNQASNGVVHVVDGVLDIVDESLSDIIATRTDLSTLKTRASQNTETTHAERLLNARN